MVTKTEATAEKVTKKSDEMAEAVPVRQEPGQPLDAWRTDMERLMDNLFQTWSDFGRLSSFREFMPETTTETGSLDDWKNQADRYFDDIYRQWAGLRRLNPFEAFRPVSGILLKPEVDISDGDDKLIIKAELPGMEKDDIDLAFDDHVLTICGKKAEDTENQYCVRERRFGSFQRSFRLPDNVVGSHRIRKGDVEKGFAEADHIVENTFETPFGSTT